MPNKKQSARPAESGWLMATALLSLPALKAGIKRFGLTLSELEELCRYEAELEMMSQGLKGTFPWRTDVVLSAGLGKGPEDETDESEWYRLEELGERFITEMQKEDKRRAGKGKDRKALDGSNKSIPRREFASWILPAESRKVIFNRSDSEYRWKLAKSLRSKSEVLGSALSANAGRAKRKASGGLGKVIELSRAINRQKRNDILKEIEERELEIWKNRLAIAGLRKWLKNVPEKLG